MNAQESIQPLDLQRINADIQSDPQIRKIVRELFLFERVDSTNQVAMQMGAAGLPGRTLIIAEAQDAGRGRLSRKWVSPHGVNLYLSLLLSPHQQMREFPLFSLASAIAVVHAIRSATGLQSVIKWPNDVLYNDKKVAGILLESGKSAAPYLVIGIGLNVNWEADAIPPDLRATSLKIALGRVVDRNALLFDLLSALASQVQLLEESRERLIQTFSELCASLGKGVTVHAPHAVFEGVAEEILEEGGLLLRLGDGTRRRVLLGDLIHHSA